MSDADDITEAVEFFGACPVCGKKGAALTRALLPHRRASATFKLRFGDQRGAYHVTCGYYDDGRLGEVFVSTNKGSQADAIARDGAILLSLAVSSRAPSTIAKKGASKPKPSFHRQDPRAGAGAPPHPQAAAGSGGRSTGGIIVMIIVMTAVAWIWLVRRWR